MRYYLDTEFNGYHGDLISMALVREDGQSRYWVIVQAKPYTVFVNAARADPWVRDNVLTILDACPIRAVCLLYGELGPEIAAFLRGDHSPVIISDWPDDIRHFCEAIDVGPGEIVDVPSMAFEMHRVDAYPTLVAGAVQHNAWWDAQALKCRLAP